MLPATGLRTHAWNTAIRSVLLLAGFPVLLAMMGYALALFLVAGEAASVEDGMRRALGLLPVVIAGALVLAALWFLIAWHAHNRILDWVTGARRVEEPAQEPRLWRLAEELCITRGMALPRLAVIETADRNAFASGLTRAKAGVTVTRGLMDSLDDRELSAVIAHELAHIRNGDARLGVVAAVFVGVITLVTDNVWRVLRAGWRTRRSGGRSSSSSSSSSSSRRSGSSGGGAVVLALIVIAIVIAVLAHLLALVLRMALSRNREYLADAGAVEMTGDADAMISALRKVEQRAGLAEVPEQVRALFLHDAKLSSGAVGWFATHPPVEERVAALVRYASGHDPGKLPALPVAEDPAPEEPAAEAEDAGPRSPIQERIDAIAAFARSNDSTVMENQAKREKARRAGLDPDGAAPPPPLRGG
jgi:heat shock protein HtpX